MSLPKYSVEGYGDNRKEKSMNTFPRGITRNIKLSDLSENIIWAFIKDHCTSVIIRLEEKT